MSVVSEQSTRLSSISGGRTQKRLPYPPVLAFRNSASSHAFVTSKGSSPLSWLSYSPRQISCRRRIWSDIRSGFSRTSELPTLAHVERTSRAFHPTGRRSGFGPNPAGGLRLRLRRRAPCSSGFTSFESPRPCTHNLCSQGMSRSPAFRRGHNVRWDRTSGLVSTWTRQAKGLLRRASLEPDEPLSWHPALRVRQHGGRLAPPPFTGWSPGLGRCRPISMASATR